MKFGKILYASTVGTFIKICMAVWFLLKFIAMYIYELCKKLYRYCRLKKIKIKAILRRKGKKAQNLTLKTAGKEF